MSEHELFEKLCNEYDLEYTKVPNQRGIILSYKGQELKLTPEYINAMFQFDEYFKMSANEVINTEKTLTNDVPEMNVPSFSYNSRIYFVDANYQLAS